MTKVAFKAADQDWQLQQILDLQQRNLEGSEQQQRHAGDGFVTVQHDLPLLRSMNRQSPHIIAVEDSSVVAYALVMRRRMAPEIPILAPLFQRLETLSYGAEKLTDRRFFVMGQVCVDKALRGRGVFAGLYRTMAEKYSELFDFVLTEIAARNRRSIAAHQKVGFRTVDQYTDQTDTWNIVIWDWQQP